MKKFTDVSKGDIPKQIPQRSRITTDNSTLLLSYDKVAPTEEGDFREALIEFLVDSGAINLQCFVATTIYFETTLKENPLTHWANILYERFEETFHFHLVLIWKDTANRPVYFEYKRDELSKRFDKKVEDYILSKTKI